MSIHTITLSLLGQHIPGYCCYNKLHLFGFTDFFDITNMHTRFKVPKQIHACNTNE